MNEEIKHHHLINNIKESQQKEMQLVLNLEKLPKGNDSLASQNKIVEQIVTSTRKRASLFRQLQAIDILLNNNTNGISDRISEQEEYLQMLEGNLERDKAEIMKNRNINVGNLRASQINTYYSEKYRAQVKILIRILYLCIPILLLAILKSRGFISTRILQIAVSLIVIIGFFMVAGMIYDINLRNNMVFSEFDFAAPSGEAVTGSDTPLAKKEDDKDDICGVECVGASCCSPGMIYDNEKDSCVIKNTKEGFAPMLKYSKLDQPEDCDVLFHDFKNEDSDFFSHV